MRKKKVKVSAIVSTYNASAFIEGCLRNLMAQTIRNQIEIIIVDSGSQENEREIVARIGGEFDRIRYVRTPKRETLYASWNRAIRLATGEYVINANTDDRQRYDAYEILSRTLDADRSVALAYSDVYLTDRPNEPYGRVQPHWQKVSLPEYTRLGLFKKAICGPCPMYRKSVHQTVGMYDERYIATGEYEFWLRLSDRFHMKHVAKPLALFYRNPTGITMSSKKFDEEFDQIRRRFLTGELRAK